MYSDPQKALFCVTLRKLQRIIRMFLPLFSHFVLVSSCVEWAMKKSNTPPSAKIFYKYLMEEAATQ